MPEFESLVLHRLGLQLSLRQQQVLGEAVESACHRHRWSPAEYYALLEKDASGSNRLWQDLASRLVIRETYFFRDPGAFADLRTVVLPALLEKRQATSRLDVWSAGCCTGEEPYSISIALQELLGSRRPQWHIRILGTDIDAEALERARAGYYPAWSFRNVPADLKRRYFTHEHNAWTLAPAIRSSVEFQVFNLLAGPLAVSSFDLVLCRNVLVYFSATHVQAVAQSLAGSLRPDGFLLVGPSELTHVPNLGLEARFLPQSMAYQPATLAAAASAPSRPPERRPKVSAVALARPAPPVPDIAALTQEAHRTADRGDHVRARALCQELLRLCPTCIGPYFLLAAMAEAENNLAEARKQLRAAMYLDPSCLGAHVEMAALLARAGQLTEADGWRKRALKLTDGKPPGALVEPFGAPLEHMMRQLNLLLDPRGSS